MFWTRRPEAVLLLALFLSAAPIEAQPQAVILAVPDDVSVIDIRAGAELLVHLGAPVTVSALPTGRIGTLMKESTPICRMEAVRKETENPDFQWIARTASFDYVAAGLTEGASHPVGAQTIAVVPLNTRAHRLAASAGYSVLPVKTLSNAIPLLQSGRALVVIAVRQEIESLAAAENVPLHVERVLTHAETWLVCNGRVGDAAIKGIDAAWNQALAGGELRGIYARSGILSLYPGP